MERVFTLSPFHGVDSLGRLRYGANLAKVLNPCEPIGDKDMKLGIIDNNYLNPKRLEIVPKDRMPISVDIPDTGETLTLLHPGKSASICLTPARCGPELTRQIVEDQLHGTMDRRDKLHMSSVGQVLAAGWFACWAPLQEKRVMLHVRLVADRTIAKNEDPTEEDVLSLASAFVRAV